MELYLESTRVFFKIFLINFKFKNESLIIKKYDQFYSYNFISFSNFMYNLFCVSMERKKINKKNSRIRETYIEFLDQNVI